MTQSKADRTQASEFDVEKVRKKANIAQVSVATVTSNTAPVTHGYGDVSVNKDTVFGAASLSKPVFAYLVLKLIEAGELTLDMKGLNDILSFQSFCEQHGFKWKNKEEISEEDIARINAFTPTMILSHKTGFDLNRANQVNHQFEPGQEYYRYSGLPLFYLQKVVEKLNEPQLALLPDNDFFEKNKLYVSISPPNLKYTIYDLTGVGLTSTINLKALDCSLQELTDVQELKPYLTKILEEVVRRGHTSNLDVLAKKYVFEPLHMDHSSFGAEPCAANSLNTTAEDYALFVQGWMNDEKLQYTFKPQISMANDPWARETVTAKKDLAHVAECLGFQLEVDENGEPITAFKTGDMGPWRGWVAIDLSKDIKQRRATVYFAKGPEPDGNGHVLAETLMEGYQLKHGLNWFKEKYGFATGLEESWEASQKLRCDRGMAYQEKSPRLPNPEERVTPSVDSTKKMVQLMPPPLEPTPKNESRKEDVIFRAPVEEIGGEKEDIIQDERKFNPSPFSTSYDPYKK